MLLHPNLDSFSCITGPGNSENTVHPL